MEKNNTFSGEHPVVKRTGCSSLSVVIATYNRGEALRLTLEAMTGVRHSDLRVEWIVVDNNSSDHSAAIIRSFSGRLPLRHLHESRPGKNCALNKALAE
jgi:glycosyltransferase involved in cell wall biosynthesis